MTKRLIMELSPKSVEDVIKELEDKYNGIAQADILNDIYKQLGSKGVDIIRNEIIWTLMDRGSMGSGEELLSSVKSIKTNNKLTFRVDSEYGAYVEFGTGVVGKNDSGRVAYNKDFGWIHDLSNHGDKGWTYYNEKEDIFQWTQGQPAGQFMIRSSVEIREMLTKILKEIGGRIK